MIYVNMGHNDMDYENHTLKTLSFSFNNPAQDRFMINALLWLAKNKKTEK